MLVTVHNTQAGESLANRGPIGSRQLKRSLFSRTVGYGLDYLCLSGCDRIVAISATVKQQLVRYYRLAPPTIEVVPNGVDVPPQVTDKQGMKEALGLGRTDRLVLACVGRLVDHKRIDVLLNALGLLKAKGAGDFRCFIVGTGPSKDDLVSQSRRLSLERMVEFTGFVSEDDLKKILAASDVIISTSVYEGWGLSVFEAASYGCAPVVSDIPAFKSNLADGINSLKFGPGNEGELAERLLTLQRDRHLLKKIQCAARTLAEGMGWDSSIAKLVRVYSELVAEGGRTS
jgi:glycosyltransferase involved in cell wall biosynthesis